MAIALFKRDNLKLGLVLGLFGPVLGLLVIYFVKFSGYTFSEFFDMFINNNRLITSLGSLCLLANVILFTLYINTNRDHTAKGIFLTTLVYGIGILVLKLTN